MSTEVHGFTDEAVARKRRFSQVPALLEALAVPDAMLVTHTGADLRVRRGEPKRLNQIRTADGLAELTLPLKREPVEQGSEGADTFEVLPLLAAPDVTVRVPGSKSVTNRALMCAALAPGRSILCDVLVADDTRAMMDALIGFGAAVTLDEAARTVEVTGADLNSPSDITVYARQSGTTSRLVLPAAALRVGSTLLDGTEQLRARPFGPQFAALRQLGATLEELGRTGCLPIKVLSPPAAATPTSQAMSRGSSSLVCFSPDP